MKSFLKMAGRAILKWLELLPEPEAKAGDIILHGHGGTHYSMSIKGE